MTPKVETDGRFTTVTVTTGGSGDVVINYTVTGAVVTIDGGTALRWALLQGLSAPVAEFNATVQIPAQFSYVRCTAGNPNSTTPCTFAAGGTEGSQIPTFRDGPRGEGQSVAVDIGFPAGAVASQRADRPPLDRRPGVLREPAAAGARARPAGARRDRAAADASPVRASMPAPAAR